MRPEGHGGVGGKGGGSGGRGHALEPLKLSLGPRAAGAMKPWGQRAMAEWAERAGGVGVAGMHWSP